ncbi:MAG TPA: thiamine phosphate synthase [Polyangiaceae bacterium]
MRGLYPIVDVDSLRELGESPLSVIAFAEQVLAAKPPLLQLRAKHSRAKDTLELLRALRPLCTRAGVRLFANDRPDLAVLAECDGVHVGQDDLPLSVVRQIAPGLLIGVSTHSLAQLAAALIERPDYVALGPVYGTVSKERADALVGPPLLAEAYPATRAAGIPLVAIGGVNLERARQIAAHCDLVAVIAALQPDKHSLDGVSEAAQALHRAVAG